MDKLFGKTEKMLQNFGVMIGSRIQQLQAKSVISFSGFMTKVAGAIPQRNANESDADFSGRLTQWLESFLNLVGLQEGQLYSESKHRVMREELTSDPFMSGAIAVRGSSNNDVFYNDRFPPASTRNTNRQRTFDNVPIAALLYHVCFVLAQTPSARAYINACINEGYPYPKFLQEKLQSCRQSTAGAFYIVPSVDGIIPNEVLTLLNLQNTIFDYNYLISEPGIKSLFSFFARIAMYSGNYVAMVTSPKPVPLNAGFTTTETALTNETVSPVTTATAASIPVDPTARIERRVNVSIAGTPGVSTPQTVPTPSTTPDLLPETVVRIIPGHSYGTEVNLVQATDSYIMNRRLLDSGDTQIYVGVFSPDTGEINANTFNYGLYIIGRMTGQIHNSNDTVKPVLEEKYQVVEPPKPFVNSRGKSERKTRSNNGQRNNSRKETKIETKDNKFLDTVSALLREGYIASQQYTQLLRDYISRGNARNLRVAHSI